MTLRHRSAKSRPSQSTPVPASSKRHPKRVHALRRAIESLEQRLLLTTLHGGDTFLFMNEDAHIEQISLFGNITAEVIGANVDGNNNVVLEDLPGILNGQPVLGGFNLTPGATPIGPITIANPLGPAITVPPQSIAVAPNGQMYGIVIQTIPPAMMGGAATNIAYLATIDKSTGMGTVVADITSQVLAAAGIVPGTPGAVVTAAPAAAFGPNGLLYFVAATGTSGAGGGGGGGGNVNATQQLFNVNVNNPTNSVAGVPGNFGGKNVTAIGFDGNGALHAASGMTTFNTNPNNTNLTSNTATTTANGPITGLASGSGLPNNQQYAITNNNGDTSEVYAVDPQTGAAIDYGPLANGATGQNPGNLTYDPTTGNLYSFDVVNGQLFTVSKQNRTRYLSIYNIYISQSDASGEILTARWPDAPQPPGMIPFSDGIEGSLRVVDAQSGIIDKITAPAASGDALVGARTRLISPDDQNANLFPLITATVPQLFTAAPYVVGQTLTPGIVSAPGTTVGLVAIGGTVMGDVNLHGSINTFYAGWLLTGNTNGELEPGSTRVVDDVGNFTVHGDIRNLLVHSSIGTDSDAALGAPTYVTGFDMHVYGNLGQVHTFDSLIGNVNVMQSPSAQAITSVQSEVETVSTALYPWDAGILSPGANPSDDPMFSNDTFATAQYLGAIATSVNGAPSADVVDGAMQMSLGDFADYYGVPLMAGQTITCMVVQTAPGYPIDLGVFDPDGRLIASDYNRVDPAQTEQNWFRFTADRPGIYRFAVSPSGDKTFTDAGAPAAATGTTPYQLTIQNVGNLAAGVIAATNNILGNVDNTDPAKAEPTWGTQNGDLGAVTAGGDIMDNNAGNSMVVQNGNLRVVSAGGIGAGGLDPQIQVPLGGVGLLDANGGSGTGNLLFNMTGLIPPPAIQGDYQVVSAVGDVGVELVTDQAIGVIRGGSMTAGPSLLHVNADNTGNDGIIDLIDITGNLGTATAGGPAIITGPEGNVRYMHVGGNVYRDAYFGASVPETVIPDETIYQPGETVTLTDDSGSKITLTPTGTPSSAPTVGPAAPPTPNGTGFTNGVGGTTTGGTTTGGTTTGGTTTGGTTTGGTGNTTGLPANTVNPALPQLAIIAYGIEGSGGVAIIRVTSTGGVTISSGGDVAGQTAEIGEIDCYGIGQGLVPAPMLATSNTQPQAPSTSTSSTGTTSTGTGLPGSSGTGNIGGGAPQGGGTGNIAGGGGLTGSGSISGGGVGAVINNGQVNNGGINGVPVAVPIVIPVFYQPPDTAGPRSRTKPLNPPPELDPYGNITSLVVDLEGPARVDAYSINGGAFTSVINNTPGGEIANLTATSVGTLASAGTLGLMQSHTPAALNGPTTISSNAPFTQAHNGIVIGVAGVGPNLVGLTTTTTTSSAALAGGTGGVGGVGGVAGGVGGGTTGGVTTIGGPPGAVTGPGGGSTNTLDSQGNLITVTTTLGTDPAMGEETGVVTIIAANGMGNISVAGDVGSMSGAVLAPVVVTATPSATGLKGGATNLTVLPTVAASTANPATGSINSITLGLGGVAAAGSGLTIGAGIFAAGQIGVINNSAHADIRGPILSQTGITGISLSNSSIIGSTIGTAMTFNSGATLGPSPVPTPYATPITNPVLDEGNIIVNGNGGIIGTIFAGNHFGRIDVHNGFGIFDTLITGNGDTTAEGIVADGYGLRGVTFAGGASIGNVVAAGDGRNVSTNAFSGDVRLSEVEQFDPNFGFMPNRLSDIDVYTGVTAVTPFAPGHDGGGTDTGVIEDANFVGSRDLGTIRAYEIRATAPSLLPSIFNFADSIGSVTTLSTIDGLLLTTGRFKLFQPGGDTSNTQIIVSGPIKKLVLKGNLLGNSAIEAIGVNGNIGSLFIGGSLNGKITATRKINNVTILGSLGGVVSAQNMGSLKIHGILNGGNLDIEGNINLFQTTGDLGLPGETLTIHGSAKTIRIGGSVNSNVVVQGKVGTFYVGHSIISGNTVNISGILNSLVVNGDLQSGATVMAALIRHKRIRGSLLGNLL